MNEFDLGIHDGRSPRFSHGDSKLQTFEKSSFLRLHTQVNTLFFMTLIICVSLFQAGCGEEPALTAQYSFDLTRCLGESTDNDSCRARLLGDLAVGNAACWVVQSVGDRSDSN